MKITGYYRDGALTLNLSGELDHHSAREAMGAISERIDAFLPRDCILNFREITFMDSSGIALILRANKEMKNLDGRLFVSGVPKQPMKVMEASGIDRLVEITENN
ncbi:MAG: STAS domain-containing protein [Oscillospiraceae bacterium]|nr:STAS domain-containing protein [Oscillospiraceae bacterium]